MDYKIERNNEKIYLNFGTQEESIKIGSIDDTDELWEIIQSSTWNITKNPKYIYSNKHKKYLHQVVMEYWYGHECCDKMKANDFVIDHIDNNGFNCVSENLAFLNSTKNRFYKGNYYDKLRREKVPVAALHIFNNCKTGKFQITIGFNQPHILSSTGETLKKLYFLYENKDYDLVLADALYLLESINKGILEFSELRFKYWRYEPVIQIIVPENSNLKSGNFININGVFYLIEGEKMQINRISADKSGWSIGDK